MSVACLTFRAKIRLAQLLLLLLVEMLATEAADMLIREPPMQRPVSFARLILMF
jgi:hypothetical protein